MPEFFPRKNYVQARLDRAVFGNCWKYDYGMNQVTGLRDMSVFKGFDFTATHPSWDHVNHQDKYLAAKAFSDSVCVKPFKLFFREAVRSARKLQNQDPDF